MRERVVFDKGTSGVESKQERVVMKESDGNRKRKRMRVYVY